MDQFQKTCSLDSCRKNLKDWIYEIIQRVFWLFLKSTLELRFNPKGILDLVGTRMETGERK